jgi:hypothetical protein
MANTCSRLHIRCAPENATLFKYVDVILHGAIGSFFDAGCIWAYRAAEKLAALKGHDFSRAESAAKSTWASATEGRPRWIRPEIQPFSAACYATLPSA